ncbi:MAG: AMP-binding protein [Deltaproteobacteria bacterium]|nr:AMP-binding protein [Deltaproteobacteria bacterium]
MLLVNSIQRNAQAYGNFEATVFKGRRRTWREFVDRVARLSDGLTSGGVSSGERVGILALNSDRYMEAFYAILWAGAIAVPMNIRWSMEENLYCVRDAGISVLFVDDAFAEMGRDVTDRFGRIHTSIFIGEDNAPEGLLPVEHMIGQGRFNEPIPRRREDLAGIYYTGGTTGFPKGVMLSHMALWASALIIAVEMNDRQPIRNLHAAPMFHIADTVASLFTTICGGAHFFVDAFNAGAVLKAIEAHQVSIVILVPTMISMLLEEPTFNTTNISSLRTLFYAASPMPEALLKRCMAKLPDVNFFQGYGQTEMAPVISLLGPEDHVLETDNARLRSAGRAVAGVRVKIADPDGCELPRGTAGEIWATGPNVMTGYWNKPDQTADTLVEGWVKTGDIAYMDEDGYIFICDRAKDMIISGGENVFSAEVESAISTHPAVSQAAVIGIPDPRSMAVVDAMPLSGAGKILKKDLRAPYWEGKVRQVN